MTLSNGEVDAENSQSAWARVVAELEEALDAVDPAQFALVVALLSEARRRWFFSGQGRSGLVASMVAMRVMHIGNEAHVVGEATCPSVRVGDVIVFFSGSGETPVTVEFARLARAEGAIIVAVTSSLSSTLSEISDRVLVVPSIETSQLGNNQFEQGSLILMDAVVNEASSRSPNSSTALSANHTNLQ